MDIEKLIQKFESFDTGLLREYEELLSSKHDGVIFPPYIPHIGSDYTKYNLMMYGMAQSFDKPWNDLINKTRIEKIRQLYDVEDYNNIWIAPYKVMLAVAGIYIYARYGEVIDSFVNIHNSIAATNYYKFSLSDKGNDVNPNSGLVKYIAPELYWKENDGNYVA